MARLLSGARPTGHHPSAYAPELNPVEGVWSLLKRVIANFAATDLDGLVRIVKRKLKKIQSAPPDHRLPRRHRPDHRTLVTP